MEEDTFMRVRLGELIDKRGAVEVMEFPTTLEAIFQTSDGTRWKLEKPSTVGGRARFEWYVPVIDRQACAPIIGTYAIACFDADGELTAVYDSDNILELLPWLDITKDAESDGCTFKVLR
jgi:hypothetical protein